MIHFLDVVHFAEAESTEESDGKLFRMIILLCHSEKSLASTTCCMQTSCSYSFPWNQATMVWLIDWSYSQIHTSFLSLALPLNYMTVGNRWKLEALPRQTGNLVCVVAEQEVLPTRVQCSQQDSAGRRGCLDRWFVSSGIHINAKTQASSALRCAAVLLAWFVVMRKQKTSIYLSIYYCY